MLNFLYKNAFQHLKSLKFFACGGLFSCQFSLTKYSLGTEILKNFRLRRATVSLSLSLYATILLCMHMVCSVSIVFANSRSVFASRARTVCLSQMIEASSCSQELYTCGTQNVSQIVETPSCSRKNNLNTHQRVPQNGQTHASSA